MFGSNNLLLCNGGGAVLCTVGHLAVSLASTPLNASSTLPNVWQPECVQTLPNVPWGPSQPPVKNRWLGLWITSAFPVLLYFDLRHLNPLGELLFFSWTLPHPIISHSPPCASLWQ